MNDLSTFARSIEGTTPIGKIFDAPIVIKGKTWFPFSEMVVWGIMILVARYKNHNRSLRECLGSGALDTIAILGSEWCHNLAHAAAAKWVGKPTQAIRVTLGMPILIYPTPEDPTVTPRQHIIRSMGGPIFNALLLASTALVRHFTRPNTAARQMADTAVGMNLFLSTASYIPNPEIDGGPILKWALVESGQSIQQADVLVKHTNKFVGMGLASSTLLAVVKKRYFLALILGLFSLISLEFGFRNHEK